MGVSGDFQSSHNAIALSNLVRDVAHRLKRGIAGDIPATSHKIFTIWNERNIGRPVRITIKSLRRSKDRWFIFELLDDNRETTKDLGFVSESGTLGTLQYRDRFDFIISEFDTIVEDPLCTVWLESLRVSVDAWSGAHTTASVANYA